MDEDERRRKLRRAADLETHPELVPLESIAESLRALALIAPKIGEAYAFLLEQVPHVVELLDQAKAAAMREGFGANSSVPDHGIRCDKLLDAGSRQCNAPATFFYQSETIRQVAARCVEHQVVPYKPELGRLLVLTREEYERERNAYACALDGTSSPVVLSSRRIDCARCGLDRSAHSPGVRELLAEKGLTACEEWTDGRPATLPCGQAYSYGMGRLRMTTCSLRSGHDGPHMGEEKT